MAPYGTDADRPKIVAVMPAYNVAKTLKITYDAIHRSIGQSILVDDGGTGHPSSSSTSVKIFNRDLDASHERF